MAAVAVAADVWNESTDAVKHTHKVHVENPSPIVERDVVDASSGADTGIVADHMDIAEGIERRLGGMLDVGRIGNVTGYGADIRPKLVQAFEGGRQSVLLDVSEHHFHARVGKCPAKRQPNAARTACHKCSLAC
jgi:hypothetical protein